MAQFNFTFDPNVSLEQRVGFEMAAAIWSQLLNDDVTLNLRVGATNELGENGQAVGGAIPIFHDTHYGVYQQYLEQDATSVEDDSVVDALQQGNTVDVTVDGEVVDGNTELMLTRAQAKALGMDEALVLEDGSTWDRDVLANPDGLDGYILINDSFDWHYDLTRAEDAPEGTLDFLTMALHEIGHALGFVSGLDGLIDTFTLHSGEQRTEGITALDLMRHSDGDGIADLTFGDAAYFSIDGGQTSLAEFEEGNDYQASHWQRYQNALGIMDPTLGYQERTDISDLDLTALDAIGWNVDYDALANGLDLNALYNQAQQTVAGTFGVDVEAVEAALTNGEDWQSLGYEAWFNAFKDQVMEQGWGTWFQGFENQILEQGWGTWFAEFQDQLLEQGWGTWFAEFQEELLAQGWGTWFQDLGMDDPALQQMWGTWFQALEDQVFEQMWGTWFQSFEQDLLNQLWGTWFQDFEAQVLEQGWGTWFQNFESQILEQGWGTWFQSFEADMLNQSWGTWFQSFETDMLNQSWGTWFQDFDAEILQQGWGTWFQAFESQQTLDQVWGTWFQSMDADMLSQMWGTWFQNIDANTFQQMWGTWFQNLDTDVLNQMWGTWFQNVDTDTLNQMWGTWFQNVDTDTLNQMWGTWFQEMDAASFQQMWGTWFQSIDEATLTQMWGTWFQETDPELFQQGWGTWFQQADTATLNQLWGTWFQQVDTTTFNQSWGTWFQSVDNATFDQMWGTWFQSVDNVTFDQMWGTWFQTVDANTLQQMWGTWFQEADTTTFNQSWGTWFQSLETETFNQMWGTWFQETDTTTLNQMWGTWFQSVDQQLLEQGWGTWFQKFETDVLEQGWGTWFQQIEGHSQTVNQANDALVGDAVAVTGSQGDDILAGSHTQNWINAGDGDDLVDGKAGNDVIFADGGNDIAYGWVGEDLIFGGAGDDFIAGENDNDQLFGEAGHDILSGGRGDDYVDGGTGRDAIQGDVGDDILVGGSGDDQLNAGSGDDLAIGGAGKDDIEGGSGDDVLYGDDFFVPGTFLMGAPQAPLDDLPDPVPMVDVTEALADLEFRMRLEAEDMELKNYNLDDQADASGGSVIKTQGEGKAETTFDGPDGTYDLVVGYYDQGGNTSEITLEVKDGRKTIAEHTILLDGSTGAGTYKIAGVSLEAGYKIKIEGEAKGSDLARLDYIDVLTAGSTGENFYTLVDSGQNRTSTRIEAESLELTGDYEQVDDPLASNDRAIATDNEGTATYTYTGESGVYNLYANYFDSDDGKAWGEVLLNGEHLHSWRFDADDNATHERTLGLDIALKQGDVIELKGWAHQDDHAIVDYLVLEDAAAADMSISGSGVIRVEAEDMTLTGEDAKVESKSFASKGKLIKTDDRNTGLTATTTFTGDTGLYNIVIGYYDLEDGRAEYSATLAGETLDSWIANRDIEEDLDESFTTRTLSSVLLNKGDTFSLQSIRDDKDKGYIDYVEFVAVNAPDTWQLEVEHMDLAGKYGVKSEDFASNRGFVETGDDVTGFTGTGLFQGEAGYYDVVVGYYDSNKGAAEIAIKVDNAELDRWYADQNLGSDKPETQSFVTRTVAQSIKIDRFDLIELTGIEDNGDKVNLDYIQFIKVEAPAEPEPVAEVEVDPDSDNSDVLRGGAGDDTAYGGEGNDILYGEAGNDILYGDFAATQAATQAVTTVVLPDPIRVEAEDMALGGDYSFENRNFASGGDMIKTSSSLTATTAFEGPAGLYDIVIGYYDENDGTSPVTVRLDGTTLDSWTFNQNLGNNLAGADNFVTRTVGSAVSLTTGTMLQLQASRQSSEFARIDYVEFIAVGAGSQAVPSAADTNTSETLTFQQGVNGYTGTVDTYIHGGNSNRSYGNATSLSVDSSDDGGATQALLRFDDIFGNQAGQIGLNTTIESAILELEVSGTGNNLMLHNMLQSWSEATNWNAMGNGIQANGYEATSAAVAKMAGGRNGTIQINVTASLQAWQQNPNANQGWAFLPTGSDGVDFWSSESGNGPRLIVDVSQSTAVLTPAFSGNSDTGYNDTLIGGSGNDSLYGDLGNDILTGTDADAAGALEIDTLTGGNGADIFVLGDINQVYYGSGGGLDYAVITDFTIGLDQLQLHGSASDYSQSAQGGNLFLYYGGGQDLVAQFQNLNPFNLNNNATFV